MNIKHILSCKKILRLHRAVFPGSVRKAFLLVLTGLLVTGTMTSCNDFLDIQPIGKVIPETGKEYRALLTSAYNEVGNARALTTFRSDEITLDKASTSSEDYNAFFDIWAWNDLDQQETTTTFPWRTMYHVLYIANYIVEHQNGITEATTAEIRQMVGECYMLRAYMHFLLAQWFALPYDESYAETELTVPLVTEANTSVMNYRRATMKEMYDFITTEMEESCPNLEDRVDHRMRVYKPTGYGLMGKVYFLMGEYDKALTALRTAYELLPKSAAEVYLLDYNELMRPYGYRELTADELDSDMDILPYLFSSSQVLWCKQTTMMNSYYFVYGDQITFYLNPEFYALYDEYDLRRNLICTVNREGTPLPYPYPGFLGDRINLGLNLPEVYLMLAECEARVGSEDKARQILADFRKYRVLPGHEEVPSSVNTKDDLIRFCIDEINREFMATGYRWYTVRRLWNDPLFQDMKPVTHFDGEQTFTLDESGLKTAIPETVLEWNESWRGQ